MILAISPASANNPRFRQGLQVYLPYLHSDEFVTTMMAPYKWNGDPLFPHEKTDRDLYLECDNRKEKLLGRRITVYPSFAEKLELKYLGLHTSCDIDLGVCVRIGSLAEKIQIIEDVKYVLQTVWAARLARGCFGTSRTWILPGKVFVFMEIYKFGALKPLDNYPAQSIDRLYERPLDNTPTDVEWTQYLPWKSSIFPDNNQWPEFTLDNMFQFKDGWCACDPDQKKLEKFQVGITGELITSSSEKKYPFTDDFVSPRYGYLPLSLGTERVIAHFGNSASRFGGDPPKFITEGIPGKYLFNSLRSIVYARKMPKNRRLANGDYQTDAETCSGRSRCWLNIGSSHDAPDTYIDILNDQLVMDPKTQSDMTKIAPLRSFSVQKYFPSMYKLDGFPASTLWCACFTSELEARSHSAPEQLRLSFSTFTVEPQEKQKNFKSGDMCIEFVPSSELGLESVAVTVLGDTLTEIYAGIQQGRSLANCHSKSRCLISLSGPREMAAYIDVYKKTTLQKGGQPQCRWEGPSGRDRRGDRDRAKPQEARNPSYDRSYTSRKRGKSRGRKRDGYYRRDEGRNDSRREWKDNGAREGHEFYDGPSSSHNARDHGRRRAKSKGRTEGPYQHAQYPDGYSHASHHSTFPYPPDPYQQHVPPRQSFPFMPPPDYSFIPPEGHRETYFVDADENYHSDGAPYR
ncbi:hypothetical protein EX30DRAFT_390272 [Ascodesmis nigricans]|uniref:Uncharacterized protein n=1 Tax=Ascodesmis nigricans TaxID=341454 RepID=A0A4S2MI07_9PEZI|nr:hypothetical protein EX30DRAFT_390272 [Ascodesmis nigricans]